MKALVTGATGFVGSWLCKTLAENGLQVEGWSRTTTGKGEPGIDHAKVDLTRSDAVRVAMDRFNPDVIFHLAAMTHVGKCETNPAAARLMNCQAAAQLFQAMPTHCRGVFASTCHVYGTPEYLPIDEKHAVNPTGIYATSKRDAELQTLALQRDIVIARGFHHTGPGQQPIFAVADWAAQIRDGCETLQVGNLAISRDYTDVRDVVKAYLVLAQKGSAGEIYNICTGIDQPLASIAQRLIGNRSIAINSAPNRLRKNDVTRLVGDPTKLKKLGWEPKITLEKTLSDMTK